MEILPCSGVQYAGESDCPQRGSGTAFVYQEEPNCPENVEQAKLVDGQLNGSLHNMQELEIERRDDGTQNVADLLTNSNCQCNGASCCNCQGEDQKGYGGFHDFDEDMINERYLTSENSLSVVDTIDSESPNNGREGDLSFSEPKWLEGDASVALWVKVTKCFCCQNLVVYFLWSFFLFRFFFLFLMDECYFPYNVMVDYS